MITEQQLKNTLVETNNAIREQGVALTTALSFKEDEKAMEAARQLIALLTYRITARSFIDDDYSEYHK